LSDSASLRIVGWRQWFGQTIEQFADASYDNVLAITPQIGLPRPGRTFRLGVQFN